MSLYTEVLSGVKLPTVTPDGCKITWDIDANHTGNLANNTLVNKTNEDITVTLFATITDGVNSEELTYSVTIVANDEDNELMDYYSSIDDVVGEALKLQLRSLITSTHTHKTSYDELKDVLQKADEDPNNSNNMILFYTGESVKKSADMNVWNREHVWAQSLTNGWFGESGAGADAHHIRPCTPSVNSSRGNKIFGSSTTSNTYYPGDEFRGDVARIIFYLMTRYVESEEHNLDFTDIAVSLELLLLWNEQDPVSQLELNRNNYIETIQGNRNPFIDYPEFAEKIWA